MGFVSGLLGTAGGMNGTGISGPQSANILNPATQQMGTDALAQQQALINAYQPGGTAALQSQQDLLGQLGQQAQGLGPNPALAQLNQATAANTANQAALMAGQRGSSQNAGLIARQASMQGAQNQQNAAGQAATLAAQQQISARQQLAAQQAQMVNQQQTGQQQYTGNVLGQINNQNNANIGMQSNINSANAGLAGQQMGAQNQMLGNITGALGAGLGLGGGGGAQQAQNNQWASEMDAGLEPMAQGGQVNNLPTSYNMMASGGMPQQAQAGPQSRLGRHLAGLQQTLPIPQSMPTSMPMMAEGGKVPVLLSPGEIKLSPKEANRVAQGANPMAEGKKVPGKPKVGGAKNDYANDTVKDDVEAGTIILPRSVTQSKNPHWEAHKFVSAIMAKNKGKLK